MDIFNLIPYALSRDSYGSVVEFIVAIDEARVRFPMAVDPIKFFFAAAKFKFF
jgi:hypothetical protein